MTYIPGAGSALTVRELDGSPSVSSVSILEVSNGTLTAPGGTTAQVATGGGGSFTAPDYFDILAALLEPDAIEPLQRDSFSYVVGASDTKYLIASYATRLGASGRMEVRDPRAPFPLRDVTLVGLGSSSAAIIIDPTLPTYADAFVTYYNRLKLIDELDTKVVAFTADNQTKLLLPGAYGAIITSVTVYELCWIASIFHSSGINLANEIGDANGDHLRFSNRLYMPVHKHVMNTVVSSAGLGTGPLGAVTYVLVPSTWSGIADPNTYDFRDDFMGATIDTGSDWTRSQSTAGNVEINTNYQWCQMKGNGNWGDNGMFSQASISRANGKIFLCDVFMPLSGIANLVVGFHDGAGQSYTDFSHGLDFTNSGSNELQVFENGNARGVVGSGWTAGSTYRVRITLGASNNATYEIQGGPEYDPLGGATWDSITPGTTSSSTTPLHAGATINANVTDCYISDVRIY